MTTATDEDLYLFDASLAPNAFDDFLEQEAQQEQAIINPADLAIKKETTTESPFTVQQQHRGSSSSSSDESTQHRRNDSAISAASLAQGWGTGISGFTMPANQMFDSMDGVENDFEASNRQMASDFDFDTAASTPSGFDPQMSYAPTPQALRGIVNMGRFGQPQTASPKMANQQTGFYIANSREASPLNAMLPGPQAQSPWSKHSPSAGLEETFNTINMNGDSPGNPAFSPNMQFNGGFSFEHDSSATPSSFGVSSPPSTVPSANDGVPRLTIQPTSLKSRVETQIPIVLTLSPMPPGAKKLKLPQNTVSKPKFLVKGDYEPNSDTLELHTSLVCTSAMQEKVKLDRALARARGEELAPYNKPSPASSASSTSSRDDEDKPLDGGEVKICAGCIQRERKRASRKKQKKPEEEEAFARDEEKRVVVFNTSQIKDWAEVARDSPEAQIKPNPRGWSASPGSMQIELPMRIACYCRHQNEKLGFQVIFTIKDHRGRVIAQSLTNPIMITDDHKTHTAPVVQPAAAPLPNAPAVPGAGVFQSSETPAPKPKMPKMFKQSFSTNDLNGLQNNFNPSFPMSSNSSNPFAISNVASGTMTPRNLSRPASPSGPQGPTTKKRKQSGSGKLPTGLTMTRLDTAPNQATQSTSSIPNTAATSPYTPNMTSYAAPPQPQLHQQHQLQQQQLQQPAYVAARPLGSGTSPPTPNGNDYINRSFSMENLSRQVMISAPPSRQPSRPGSPISGRNSFSGAEQTLSAVDMQPMNQMTRRAPPLIHKLVPGEGSVTGGTEVTLLGNGFYQGLEVMFGDTEATTTTFWGEKCLNCIAPPALQPGTVTVVFKHEHRNYVQQSPQARPMLFTYTDDRELEMFRLALRTIGKHMSLPTDDPYSAAQQLLQSSQQSLWGAPSGYMGQQRGGGGVPMDMLELETTMVQLLDYMDLRAPSALTKLDVRRPTGLTMLHLASSLGLTRFVAGLLARGANPHLLDNNGHTPMHHAAMSGHTHIIHRLRMSGASHKVRSLKSFTPADLATSLLAYQAVTVPSAHYRSRSLGGTPMRLHSRNESSTSLHSFWEQETDYSTDSESEDGDRPHDLAPTRSRSRPSSRRGSHQSSQLTLAPPQPEANETLMTAWRDQLQGHIQRYNEATQALQSMMPSFPALANLQQDYQANVVRRVSQLFPQRPSTSGSNPRRNEGWWDTLTGRSPSPTQQPPAYESLFPADGPSADDLSLKKLSEETAAADTVADRHFEAQSSSQAQNDEMGDMLVSRNIKRVELSQDRKLFFIWVSPHNCFVSCEAC